MCMALDDKQLSVMRCDQDAEMNGDAEMMMFKRCWQDMRYGLCILIYVWNRKHAHIGSR